MTFIQYMAEAKGGRILELPPEAEQLHLMPGDKVSVQLGRDDASQSVARAPKAPPRSASMLLFRAALKSSRRKNAKR